MRTVRVDKNRTADVPTTWAEGERMIEHALGSFHDGRGGNLVRQSVAARVAFGLFGERFLAADPTDALVFLLQEICKRKGAGLNKNSSS